MNRRPSFGEALSKRTVVLVLCVLVPVGTAAADPLGALWIGPGGTGGDGAWSDDAYWSTGVSPNNGTDTYLVSIDDGKTVDSDVSLDMTVTIDGLTVDDGDSLTIENGYWLTLEGGGLTNDGQILFDASALSGSLLVLRLSGSQTLAGTGEIVMNDDPQNIVRAYSDGQIVTNGASHTIRGAGTLLGDYGGMINEGTIIAEGDNALILDPDATDGFDNRGTLQASGAGGLRLNAGTFTNAGGTIEVLAGSQLVIQNAATVTGGSLGTSGTGKVLPESGSTLDNMAVVAGSTVEQNNGQLVTITGGLVHDGTWNVLGDNDSGSLTQMLFSGTQTLSGSGEIVLNDDPQNTIRCGNDGQILALAAGATIRGAGKLMGDYGGMINEGTIIAEGDNALIIDPDATDGFENCGTLRASGAGGLRFDAGTFVNTGRTIEIADGSQLRLMNASTVDGGVLSSAGAGRVVVESGASLNAVEVAAGSVVDQDNGHAVTITGGLVHDGTWNVLGDNASASLTALLFNGTQTLSGSGEIVLNDDPQNTVRCNIDGQILTLASGATIRGAGRLMGDYGGMINEGTIIAEGASELIIDPDATDGFENRGTLRASGTGGLRFDAGTFVNTGRTIEIDDGSQLHLMNASIVEGGALSGTGSAVIVAESGAKLDGVTLAAGSVADQDNGHAVTITGGLTNNGTWSVTGSTLSGALTTLLFSGTQTLSGSGEIVLNDDAGNTIRPTSDGQILTHAAGHTIRGAGHLLYSYGGMINRGTILVEGSSGLEIQPDPTDGFVNEPGGVVGGEGTIEFVSVDFDNDGVIAPGLSAGALTIDGSVVNADTSELRLELAGASSYDTLDVTGAFAVDGEISVSLLGAFVPSPTDTFTVLTAGTLSGYFDNAVPAAGDTAYGVATGGVAFDVSYDFPAGTVTLSNVTPEPASLLLVAIGGAVLMRRRR